MAGLIQEIKLFGEYIPWFQSLREKGLNAFTKQDIPTAKTEDWKYTKPRDLNADNFKMLPSAFLDELHADIKETCDCCQHNGEYICHCNGDECQCDAECHCDHCHSPQDEIVAQVASSVPFDAYQIHFYNGKFVPIYPALPKGVEIMTLMEAVLIEEAKPYLGKLVNLEAHPFAALNTAYMEEGLFIRIDKDVKLDKPLMIVNHTQAGDDNLFYNLRNLVVMEKGSKAELVEWYNYTGARKSHYFANIVSEIFLSSDAILHQYKLQEDAYKANHLALTVVKQKSDSQYKSFCMQKGANIGRNEVKALLTDKNAQCQIDAAYLMNGWATLDTTTTVEHLAPQTFSEQLVKGVVSGDAKGVFQGKIHIAQNAIGTEGKQQHRALLLSDTAEIDVKPELEIFADDVKCSHGAASGELDEEALFYMRSRGIGEEDAKQILIDAYLEDVFAKIENASIRDWIKNAT